MLISYGSWMGVTDRAELLRRMAREGQQDGMLELHPDECKRYGEAFDRLRAWDEQMEAFE